jgi:hypothetical protein
VILLPNIHLHLAMRRSYRQAALTVDATGGLMLERPAAT